MWMYFKRCLWANAVGWSIFIIPLTPLLLGQPLELAFATPYHWVFMLQIALLAYGGATIVISTTLLIGIGTWSFLKWEI